MASNDYHFITEWRVESTLQEVAEILGNAVDLMRWWPSVYLNVEELETGDTTGVGKVVDLYTKGWLPYTLRWRFSVTESNAPYGFKIEAWGDFVGRGIWTFEQQDNTVKIIYDWKIRADKPMLRYLSFIMKPVFSMNHRWAMERGEESLKLEMGAATCPISRRARAYPCPTTAYMGHQPPATSPTSPELREQ